MPHAASGRLQHSRLSLWNQLKSGFNAARGKWSVATKALKVWKLRQTVGSMPHAASGRVQQHHVGSPMILDLTGTIWREMQNYSIFSNLEHVHKSEI